MTTTLTDNVTHLDLTELVDVENEPGCEHGSHPTAQHGHSGPAWAVVRCNKPCGCSAPENILICKGGYDMGMRNPSGLRCHRCGRVFPSREAWTLASVL